MILVPAGTFTMGADQGGEADEHPAHSVDLAAFWLDRTEVTQHEYQACIADSHCAAPAWYVVKKGGPKFAGPNKPVTGVSWNDANAFCTWKGKRLPREAEFEKAVRGNDGRRYPWGNAAPTAEITVFATSWPDDVGSHPKGRGPFGHDDLAGNVWEWTADDYDPYFYARPSAKDGIPGTCNQIAAAQTQLRREHREGFTGSNPIPTECEKSIRGGAYNYDAWGLRSTNRVHHPGHFRLLMTGFRCAKDAA
jgi:formylglycine-generating enzyme required for sulfatase activity